jgi:DNA replication protein DnaC
MKDITVLSETLAHSIEVCSRCLGSGFEQVEGRGVKPCGCRERELAAKRIERASIPTRHAQSTFESFEATSPALQRALETSRRFASEFPDVDCGLLYLGSPGVGKTHLAVSVLRAIIEGGYSGLFFDFNDLLKSIQDSYNPNTQTTELQILNPVYTVDLLVLDELGATKPTEWAQATMTHIISRRYNDRRATIFTSNYLDLSGPVSDETLTQRIGPRFRSRLHEMCKLVAIESRDFREVIRDRRATGFKENVCLATH